MLGKGFMVDEPFSSSEKNNYVLRNPSDVSLPIEKIVL